MNGDELLLADGEPWDSKIPFAPIQLLLMARWLSGHTEMEHE